MESYGIQWSPMRFYGKKILLSWILSKFCLIKEYNLLIIKKFAWAWQDYWNNCGWCLKELIFHEKLLKNMLIFKRWLWACQGSDLFQIKRFMLETIFITRKKKESKQYKNILFRSIHRNTSKSFSKMEIGLNSRLYEDVSEILDPLGTLDPSQQLCYNHVKTCLMLISRLERPQWTL